MIVSRFFVDTMWDTGYRLMVLVDNRCGFSTEIT